MAVTTSAEVLEKRKRGLWVLLLFLLALGLRSHDLGGSGIQNDEQMWHERSARFVQSILGPFAPNDLNIPTVYWPKHHVDLTGQRVIISDGYPFNIKMPAHHPGTPIAFLIGLSYLFLAEGSSGWSLELVSVIEAGRIPTVILGSLLVVVVFLLGRILVGERAALFAALLIAVEPTLVGYSRLARLDLSGAFWATSAVLLFLMAQRHRRVALSMAAGIFAGLATATIPYGLYIIPAMAAVKLLYGGRGVDDYRAGYGWHIWQWFDRLDGVLIGAWIGTFFVAYPNLWPNPLLGLAEIARIMASMTHVTGEPLASSMPISPWFYLVRAPAHVLPWTLAFMVIGIIFGLRHERRATVLLLIWGGAILLFLSLPPGRKGFKNFLFVMPVVMVFAGMGIDWLISWITRKYADWERRSAATLSAALLLFGLSTTIWWWPYPQVHVWPWLPDPQTQPLRELVGAGEGVKEAIAYIRENGTEGDRIAMFTGKHNAAYYYDPDLLQDIDTSKHPKGFAWLVALPKETFAAAGHLPLIRWLRTRKPAHIIRKHQIELVRVYRLN